MNRPSRTRSRLASFTLFDRLLALPEWITTQFHHTPPRSARLGVEAMEERIVPDGRPLPYPVIFAGSGLGEDPVVKAYDAETGDLKWSINPYTSLFQGGVHVGTGDLTGDGYPDLVTVPAAGLAPRIKVFDGHTGDQISGPLGSFFAYAPGFSGSVHVAAADVDGDGIPDIVTGAVLPAGPKVRVFSGADGSLIANFVVTGSAFENGIKVAAADVTGDGKAEIVIGAGAGGDGWVRTYDPLTGTVISGPLGSFQAFGTSYSGSVYVGSDSLAGDVNGDGTLDLAVGTGYGSTSQVRVFDGATGDILYDFPPFGSSVSGGARVALAYVDDDEFADVVVGSGPGSTSDHPGLLGCDRGPADDTARGIHSIWQFDWWSIRRCQQRPALRGRR